MLTTAFVVVEDLPPPVVVVLFVVVEDLPPPEVVVLVDLAGVLEDFVEDPPDPPLVPPQPASSFGRGRNTIADMTSVIIVFFMCLS